MSKLRLGLGPLQLSPVCPRRETGNLAPVVANPIPDQSASEGTAFSFQFAANAFSDPEGGPLTYAATLVGGGPLPAWLTFTPATRTFSGTPGAGDFADLAIRVTATDPGSLSAHDDFLLAVNGKPVVANPIPDQQAAYNAAFSFQFATNAFADPDGDLLAYSADLSDGSPLPSWLTFTPATRTFSGTPALADLGTLQVRVTASDGTLQVTDVFSLEAVFVPANDSLASCFIDKFCTASLFDDGAGSFTGVLNNAPAPATGSWRVQSVTDRVQGLVFTAPSVAERITWNHVTKRFQGDGTRRLSAASSVNIVSATFDYSFFVDAIVTTDFDQYLYAFNTGSTPTRPVLRYVASNDALFAYERGSTHSIVQIYTANLNVRRLIEVQASGVNSRMLWDAVVAASSATVPSATPASPGNFSIFGFNAAASGNYLYGSSAGIWMFKGGVTTGFEAAMRAWVSGEFV